MGELLENGMIRFMADFWDEDLRAVGTTPQNFPPTDPYYEYLIMWLPPQDKPKARGFFEAAHPEKATV